MKFQVAFVAALFGLVAAYDEVTICPSSEFMKLAPLASNPNLSPCQGASGFSMLPPTGYPTPEQRTIMCKTPACRELITAVQSLNPSDCLLAFGDVKLNVKKLTDEFEPSCQA